MPVNTNTFVNCPFDEDYKALHEALVFAVHDCGYVARSSQEFDDGSVIRIQKIYGLIKNSQYGIHDLSRTELDSVNGLPRFNMPLELGLFLGAKEFGGRAQKNKMCLVLVQDRHEYQKYCSDISGQDVSAHGGEPDRAIEAVRNWFRRQTTVRIPGPKTIVNRYREFQAALPAICDELSWDCDDLIFNDFTTAVAEWCQLNKWA